MKKILVIEDEKNIRKLVAYDLKHSNYEVDEASEGNEALEKGLTNKYDLMIVDWMLPNIDGISLVKKFREHNIDSIFLMLTAKGEEEDILEAFEAGVDDYVSKPFSPRVLQARVKAHLSHISIKEQHTNFLDLNIDEKKRSATVNGKEISLTKKEYELLKYFMENANIVLSRDQILNEIWGFDYDGDTRIVDVHTFKLRNKLKGSKVAIKSCRGVGYIMEEERG